MALILTCERFVFERVFAMKNLEGGRAARVVGGLVDKKDRLISAGWTGLRKIKRRHTPAQPLRMRVIVPVLAESYSLAGIKAPGGGSGQTSELGNFGPGHGHTGNLGEERPFRLGVAGATTLEAVGDSR